MMNIPARIAYLLLLALLVSGPARADSWAPPQTESIVSANGQHRLTIEPAPIDSALTYFSEEIEAASRGEGVDRPAPMALLESRGDGDDWAPRWTIPLLNPVAPASFLVTDKGQLVTFDNWHSIGLGQHVIVLYDPAGALIASLELADFLPASYIEALPRSVSSLNWRRDAHIGSDRDLLMIDVVIPGKDRHDLGAVRFAISLSDGAVAPVEPSAWISAQAQAAEHNAASAAAHQARLAWLREPLLAPKGCEMREWNAYVNEAFQRLTPDYLDSPVPATKILFPPTHERFEASKGWLLEAISNEQAFGGNVAIASPCGQQELLALLGLAFRENTVADLTDSTFYIFADEAYFRPLEQIVGRSGAALVLVDTAKPIPQRPERIPGSAEEASANAERARRLSAEMDAMMEELGEF